MGAIRPRKAINPLLTPSTRPHGVVALDSLRPHHFLPAYQQIFKEANATIKRIVARRARPNFENTVELLEQCLAKVEDLRSLYSFYKDCIKAAPFKNVLKDLNRISFQFDHDLYNNAALADRIKHVIERREELGLMPRQDRLLNHYYNKFSSKYSRKDGTPLETAEKQRLKIINTRISNLCDGYNMNLMNKSGEDLNRHNLPIIFKILPLRHQKAKLLGYETYAHLAISKLMAKTPENVIAFLGQQLQEMQQSLSQEKGNEGENETLDACFPLDNVIDGLFQKIEGMFNIHLIRTTNKYPTHDPNVQAFEIQDNQSGEILSICMLDLYASNQQTREGAGTYLLRSRKLIEDQAEIPVILICCNFTRPTENQACLLNLDDLRILFHEFGHALQMSLDVENYFSITGSNVKIDFSEVVSKFLEFLILREDTLRKIGRHYNTGKQLTAPEIQTFMRLRKAEIIEEMQFTCFRAILDIMLHSTDPAKIKDLGAFENDILIKMGLPPQEPGELTCTTNMWHLFATDEDWPSGFYGYLWSHKIAQETYHRYIEFESQSHDLAKEFGMAVRHTLYANRAGQTPEQILSTLRINFRGASTSTTGQTTQETLEEISEICALENRIPSTTPPNDPTLGL